MSIVPHEKVDRTEYKRKYYQDNKEKLAKYYQDNKEKLAKYRQDNKEKRIEYNKKYRQDNKEKLTKYRQGNKEKLRANCKKYYQDNKEKRVANSKKYRQDNKEKIAETFKKYRQDNKEKLIVSRAKTRANKNNVPFDIDEDYIKKIWPKHNICPIFKIKLEQSNLHTGDQSPSLDRIIPKLGYVKGNVQIMSSKANRIKNNATFEELIIIGKYYERQLQAVLK
jgi:hypothetical protein